MASEFSYQDVINNDYPAGVYLKKYDFVTDTEKGDEYWVSEITIYGVPTLTQLGHTVNNTESDQIQVNNLPKLTHKPDAYLDINKVTTITTGGDALSLGYAIYFGDSVMTGVNTHHYRLFESVSNSVAISANPTSTTHILSDSVLALEWDLPNGKYKTPAAMLVNKKLPMGSRVLLVAYDIDDNVISELSLNTVHSRCRSRGLGVINGIELVSPYMSSSDPSLIDIRDRVGTLKLSDFKIKLSYVGSEPTLNSIDGTIFRADGLLDMINTKGDLKSSVTISFRVPVSGGCHHVSRRYNLVKTYMAPAEIPDFVEVPEAHWILNESEGSILYDNVGGHHAEISGGYTYGQLAMVNRDETSILVDGTAIAVAQDTELLRPGTGDYAISVWLKWDDANGTLNTIFDKSDNGVGPKIYTYYGIPFVIQDKDDADYRLEGYNQEGFIQNFLPTHALLQRRVINGVASLEVYLNGAISGTKVLPDITDHSNTTPITLFENSTGNYADLHYWANRSFSESEALALYNESTQFQRLPRWLGIASGNDSVGFNSIVASDYVPGLVIAKSTNKTMTKSTDGGKTWNEIILTGRPNVSTYDDIYYGLRGPSLVNVVDNIWLVSMPGGQTGRSIDNGDTWTWFNLLPSGIFSEYIINFFTVNRTYGVVYAKDPNRDSMFVSRDSGSTWAEDTIYPSVENMSVAPSGVMVRSRRNYDVGLMERSTDGGFTWTALDPYLNSGGTRYSKPAYMNHNGVAWVVVMDSDGKNVVSFDDGATWTASNISTSDRPVYGNGAMWYANHYISSDNGLTWQDYIKPQLAGDSFWESHGDNFISFAYGGYIGGSVDNLTTWQSYPWWANACPPSFQGAYNRPHMTWVGDAWLLTIKSGYVSRYTPPNRVS